MRLSLATFPARFRMRFAHGSANRAETENVICIAEEEGVTGYGEGCPRAYVTGETVESAGVFFAAHQASLSRIADLEGLRAWIAANDAAISRNAAAFCAVELAIIDLFAHRTGQGIETLLGLPAPRGVTISAVFGITGRMTAVAMALGYRALGIRDAKVKISDDRAADSARLRLIRQAMGARIRVDANNLFRDAESCIAHLRALQVPVWAVEEPLSPRDLDGMASVAKAAGCRVILDESAARPEDLEQVGGETWIVNLRISKMGGLIRSLTMLERARQRGLGVILGCHVGETSLLTRAGLALAAAAGDRLEAVETAYGGYLLARDLTRPRLRFGRGGLVRPPSGHLEVDRKLLSPLGAEIRN